MENVAAFSVTALGLAAMSLYLLPSLVEVARGRRRAWVVAVNVLLGWTVAGWFVALAWSAAPRSSSRPPTPRSRPPVAPDRPLASPRA